jgi:hypothetical protein
MGQATINFRPVKSEKSFQESIVASVYCAEFLEVALINFQPCLNDHDFNTQNDVQRITS